jgi:hypothetical protein
VGDRNPVHADVIVVTEIQKFFSSELSDVDGNDRVRDLKTKNDVLDRIHCLLELILAKSFASTHIVNLSTMMSR